MVETQQNFLSIAKKATYALRDNRISYKEYGDLLLEEQNIYSDETIRKFYYIFNKIVDKIDDNIDYTSDDILNQLKEIKEDIYKERVKLRDQRREYNKFLAIEARYENLKETMLESIQYLPPIELKSFKKNSLQENVNACLCLSDWHCGACVDNEFNFYNIDVLISYVEQLKNKTIEYCSLHKVNKLYIEINGDMVSGLIHVSTRVESEENVTEQIVTVSEILCNFINDLKPYFEDIIVITTLGNHGRLTPNKNDSITRENFEMFIPVFLKYRLKDVRIIKSLGQDFIKYNIGDKLICVAHGQNDKIINVVKDFMLMYKEVPSEIHLAHTHSYKDINECDVMITVNGSLLGSDDYAVTLRKITQPSQTLIIYGNDRCVYNLKVK